MFVFVIHILLLYQLDFIVSQTDPCNSTNHRRLEEVKRSAGYILVNSEIAISDDRLDPGWYRIIGGAGTEMPTGPPGNFRCKTWYPIWLNGSLPTGLNHQVSHQVCIQTFTSVCERTWSIDIIRCTGNFLVYNLTSSTLAKSAYCFGTEVECPGGQYSETGYSPGCTTDFPPEVFSPVVSAELAEGVTLNINIGPRLEAVFRCSFADVDGQAYSYDVYWYINEQSVVAHKRLAYNNTEQSLLRPTDWVGQYQMNMVVKCAVRARLNASSVPGPYYHSSPFAAGVKPEKTVYQVLEGEEIAIPITTSVPVECVGSFNVIRQRCTQTIKISQPRYQGNPLANCVNNIQEQDMVFNTQECGVTFSTNNWEMSVNLSVTGYVDNVYNTADRTSHIRLKVEEGSSTGLSGVWDTVNIPDIQIVVSDRDSAVTSRLCKTWNDPQYTTADGKRFAYHGSGEYILYRHKRYPYWVHTLTTSCSRGACNCGIAIRSHDSLFVVRTCDVISTEFYASGRQYPSMTYSVCDNKHMIIEKLSGNHYKVTLPIGTIITFRISGRSIPTITIKPSALDIEQAEGLCGYISKTKDTTDDFMPRGSNSTVSKDDFAISWRVERNSSDELFSSLPTFPKEDLFLKEYCLCAEEATQTGGISGFTDVHCNLTEPMVQCKNITTPLASSLYQECHRNRRRKRAVDSDDVFEDTPLTYDSNYDPDYLPPEPEWQNGWTEDSARQTCTEGLSHMTALELCQEYAHIDLSFYIESCIDDIKIAGSTAFLEYTIWLMEDACRLEVSKNESLFRSNSSSGEPTVLDILQNQLCPSNCSNNGYCNMSVCVCNTGFIGFDCSVTLSAAPTELTIPNKGLCSTKTRLCQKTNIFTIFDSEKVYCKLQHFTVPEIGKQLTSDREAIVTEAVYHYENMVSCDIPTSRKRRSTDNIVEGYDISLSYDGTNYGDSVSFIIYDEDCFTCNATTVTCVKLDTCDTTVPPETETETDQYNTTTEEPTTIPVESTTIPVESTTMPSPTTPVITTTSEEPTTTTVITTQRIEPPTTTATTKATTMIPTVTPCTSDGLNRTDKVLGEECGKHGANGRCTVPYSACMQSRIDTSWKCRCSQGFAKRALECEAMPNKLFSSGQLVMETVQESETTGFAITSINFDEVISGFDVSNPTAEIKGPESSLFTVTTSTNSVTLKLYGSLDRLNYVIFVTVSVTIDNVVIRDFVEVRISVSSEGVIGQNVIILHGTPKGNIIGQICKSCITGGDVISVPNSDVYGVNMEGSVVTTKLINLDTLQSTKTIFNSTYMLVYKNDYLIANVTIIVIRSQYTLTLDEGSDPNTQVALLNDIFQTFVIYTDGLGMGTSGDVINLGSTILNYEEQTEVTKTLSFSNPTSIMDHLYVLITIKVQDVNDVSPQFQQKPYNYLTVQSSYQNLIVGVVKADDPDMNSMLTYDITPSDVLSINDQGVIKADKTITGSNYTAIVTVSDGRHSDTVDIVVDLLLPTNINLKLEFTGQINENENAHTMIQNISIDGYNNYRFTDQAAQNDLSLDSVTGLVKSVRPFNRENVQERQFKFTIVGNDASEASCSLVIIGEITVNVMDVNDEPPVFINTPYTATVVEESSGEPLKMNIAMDTTDKDVNPTVSYSLVNHQDKFDIDSQSGIIKTNVNIDREMNPSLFVSVRAYDGVNSATAVISVTIEDINDNNPSFTSLPYNFAVDENSEIGTSIGTISASDSDIGKNAVITYQIISDGGYFRINQTTGEITISRNLDREMNTTHKPIVYARDNGDNILSSSVTVTISVNDINDNAPIFSSDRIMVEFEENKDCSNIITTLTATDRDKPNSDNSLITYSLLSGSAVFEIDQSTGSLRCQTMLNYENINSYTLLVNAQDNGSPSTLSSNKTVIINVMDINDNTPTFDNAKNSITIRYFTTVQRVIEVINVVDMDSGANGMVNLALSGTASAFLTINNKGILKTTSSNTPNDGTYSLTITATDMSSPSPLTSSHSMTVTVNQISTQPITFLNQEINMTIMENSNIGVRIGTISTEVRKPLGTDVTFEIIDEKADIKFSLNSDDGEVTLKGSTDREDNDIYEFVVRVKNKVNDAESDLALVRVRILDENDNKPIFDRETFYFELSEDSPSGTTINPMEDKIIATDADIGMNAVIEYTLLEFVGCPDVFIFKETTNSIELTGILDYESYKLCKLTVKAHNPNNKTMSSTVNVHIIVLDANDNPPEFLHHTNNVYTVSIREDTTINTEIPLFGLLQDKDSRQNGAIELSTVPSCLFDVNIYDMKIRLQVKPSTTLDYESSIHVNTCIIKAVDKGASPLTATATLSISITDVNDNRPQITSLNTNVNVSRDARVGHVVISQIPATDADSAENGALLYSLKNSQYSTKFVIDPVTGRIAINSPLRFVQTDKITLMAIVSDKGTPPLSSAVVVTILITDENPRPYLEQTPVINIQEHTQRQNGEIVRVKAYDGVNANGVVKDCDCTFRLDTNRDDLKIDPDSGIVMFKNKHDSFDREEETNSKVFVSVIASDKEDPPKDSEPMIITINIMDINDEYPRFTLNIYHFKVYQKAPNAIHIGTVTAIDKDLAPDTRYSINITESSFSPSVVSINEITGEVTKSGNMTLNQASNTEIMGWVYAQDHDDALKQPDSKQIIITIEFDDKNNHTPTFNNEKYNTDMLWDAEVEQSIVKTMATDDDSGVEGTISYSIVEGNSRGFFKIDNNGVLMLAYKLDSSIGTDATEIVTLTVKAMDGGIIPKYSSAQVIIRISGNNPGVCVQGTAHSKQVLDITEERNNWSYAMYALVAALCVAIVCSLLFLYKWRTTSVPKISHPFDKDNKHKYFSSESDYNELGKRNTVEYSHSNQGFDPMDMLNLDPYSTPDDVLGENEPKPDYADNEYKSAPAGVMSPFASTFNSSS